MDRSLTQSDLVDRSTAAQAGRLVGADYLVYGALVGAEHDTLAIDLKVVQTESARVVVAEHLVNRRGTHGFVEMVDTMADRLIQKLDLALSPEELARVHTARTLELDALLAYGGQSVAGSTTAPSGPAASGLDAVALVAWLAQPGADPEACDPSRTDEPRIERANGALADVLVSAHDGGRLTGQMLVACLGHVDDHLSADQAATAWTAYLDVVRQRVKRGDAETRFAALGALAGRPGGAHFAARSRREAEEGR